MSSDNSEEYEEISMMSSGNREEYEFDFLGQFCSDMATHPSSSSSYPVLKVARNAYAPTFGKDTIEEMEGKPKPNDSMSGHQDPKTAEWIEKLQGVLPPETCEVDKQCIYKVPPRIRKAQSQVYTPQIISIGPFHNPRGRRANEATKIFRSMEDLKLKYLKGFLNRTKLSVEYFLSRLKLMEDNIRNCYAGGPVISKYNSNDFLQIIITDACFIIELFLRRVDQNWKESDPILSKTWLFNHIKLDMILLENQLPFFVLQDIYDAGLNSKFPSFIEITTYFFKGFNQHGINTKGLFPKHFVDLLRIFLKPPSFDLEQNEQETNPIRCCSQCTGNFKLNFCLPKNKKVQAVKKIKKKEAPNPIVCSSAPTDDFQLTIETIECSSAPTDDFQPSLSLPKNKEEQDTIIPIQTPPIETIECSSAPTGDFQLRPKNKEEQETNRIDHVYSASQFSEAGLKFEVSKEDYKCLLDLKFDDNKGVLKMPCFYVHDDTEIYLRNILAFEECHFQDSGYIAQYMKILDFLINTEKDVSILVDSGIIINWMGDASSVATVITNLNKNVSMPRLNPNYLSLCRRLNAFYQNPLNKYKAILRHEYFNTPWKIASTSAAVLLLLLTLIQTIFSV